MPDQPNLVEREEELAPLSALQHFLYCPRQCALIHIEQIWAENRYTAEGRLLHDRVDAGGRENREQLTIERRVPVRSFKLGVSGIADVVEIHGPGRIFPVEYKRGRPKAHRADEVQLCAQAMCLEEMLEVSIMEGALFYGKNRRRKRVLLDPELRELTTKTGTELRQMLIERLTPQPEYSAKKCNACSLENICQPRHPNRKGAVNRLLSVAIED